MKLAPPETLFDELTDFLLAGPSPAEMAAYKVSAALDQRLHELLDKNSQGGLTSDEQEELNRFLHVNHLLIVLKAKARLKLKDAS